MAGGAPAPGGEGQEEFAAAPICASLQKSQPGTSGGKTPTVPHKNPKGIRLFLPWIHPQWGERPEAAEKGVPEKDKVQEEESQEDVRVGNAQFPGWEAQSGITRIGQSLGKHGRTP